MLLKLERSVHKTTFPSPCHLRLVRLEPRTLVPACLAGRRVDLEHRSQPRRGEAVHPRHSADVLELCLRQPITVDEFYFYF